MRKTIDELMAAVGCLKWPERWRDIYDNAMEDFEQNGCPLTDSSYYVALANTYGILSLELDTYCRAADEIHGDEDLSRLLHLLYISLAQEEYNISDTNQFRLPFPPSVDPWLGRDMLPGLALCSQIPRCAQTLRKRDIPEEIIQETLQAPEITVKEYRLRHNGLPGFDLLDWYQKTIAGILIPMGRLEMELFTPFLGDACVFQNTNGQVIALADALPVHRSGFALGSGGYEHPDGSWVALISETTAAWEGYPFDKNGCVQKETVRLEKTRWKKVLSKNDPVVQLHIPSSGKLTEKAVTQSIEKMRVFLHTYYPEYHYKAFSTASWMINPVLEELLDSSSNIVRFGKRFHILTRKIHGISAFYFVFMQPDNHFQLADLPETTTLQKVLKQHYLSGNVLHEVVGFFF